MSVHFSPSFRTCAPLAGPGAYCSRSVIFSLSSFSLVLIDPCGRGGVREHLRERTRTDGTEPARHPPPEVVQVSVGRDGAVRPLPRKCGRCPTENRLHGLCRIWGGAVLDEGGDLVGGTEIGLVDDAGLAIDAGAFDDVIVERVAFLLS